MVSSINIALTGLAASSKRLEVASNNIANLSATRTVKDGVSTVEPYRAQQVVQTSLSTGGVLASVVPSSMPVDKVFSPDHPDADESGFVNFPNVNMEEQLTQTQIASYDYKANLKSIRAQDSMFKSLLDILS